MVVEQDSNKETKVVETTERPIAPPRAKSKPPRGEAEAGAQENHADRAPKPEPPQRPDLTAPPPVKPKPKPARSEPPDERKVSTPASDNETNPVTMNNASLNEDAIESNAQDIQTGYDKVQGTSESGPSVGGTKKVGPPPIPRRVDLE